MTLPKRLQNERDRLAELSVNRNLMELNEADGEYVELFSYQYKEWYQDKLDKALQSWREFLGEESGSEMGKL